MHVITKNKRRFAARKRQRAEALRSIRLALGLTQRAFAEKLGTFQNRISDYERGTMDVPLWLIDLIVDTHGVDPRVFF